jgi:hypothetical protein
VLRNSPASGGDGVGAPASRPSASRSCGISGADELDEYLADIVVMPKHTGARITPARAPVLPLDAHTTYVVADATKEPVPDFDDEYGSGQVKTTVTRVVKLMARHNNAIWSYGGNVCTDVRLRKLIVKFCSQFKSRKTGKPSLPRAIKMMIEEATRQGVPWPWKESKFEGPRSAIKIWQKAAAAGEYDDVDEGSYYGGPRSRAKMKVRQEKVSTETEAEAETECWLTWLA